MHWHKWGKPVAGTQFLGFFSWEWRTRILYTCEVCGKTKVTSIKGAWSNRG